MSCSDWIDFWANVTPNKVAAIDASTHRELTYSLLNKMGAKLAFHLQQDFHLTKGSRIVVLAQNCFEYLYLFSAAQKIGICIVPLNYRLTASEVSALLDVCRADLILYEKSFETLLSKDDKTFDINAFFKNVDALVQTGIYTPVTIDENDPIFILFTSGSSGYPKGVKYTHKMLFWNSVNTQISLIINSHIKTIVCMPPFHTGGWNVLLTPLLHVGGQVVLMHKFDAGEVLKLIEHHQCQIFMGVPTMLKMMKDHVYFENSDLSSLDYIIVGGEAMSLELIQDYHKKGIPIRQGYGMTEVGPNLTSLHEDRAIDKIGSIGKPNMYVAIKLVKDNGEEASIGESGELWLKGPVVTPGYDNNIDQMINPFEKEGWFKTGDVAYRDDEGFLYIIDRKKNMFISGGENVYPAEVERILLSHDSISEAVVVGVPDNRWGEVGYAMFVCQSSSTMDTAQLHTFCIEQLSKYKIPKYFVQVDSLAKTDTGKLNRKLIQEQAKLAISSKSKDIIDSF